MSPQAVLSPETVHERRSRSTNPLHTQRTSAPLRFDGPEAGRGDSERLLLWRRDADDRAAWHGCGPLDRFARVLGADTALDVSVRVSNAPGHRSRGPRRARSWRLEGPRRSATRFQLWQRT